MGVFLKEEKAEQEEFNGPQALCSEELNPVHMVHIDLTMCLALLKCM
jgi:hypothetical protein